MLSRQNQDKFLTYSVPEFHVGEHKSYKKCMGSKDDTVYCMIQVMGRLRLMNESGKTHAVNTQDVRIMYS